MLDGFFRQVVQRVIDTALEGALPALPLRLSCPRRSPSGCPPALTSASSTLLELNASHFVLLGNFGTR